MSKSTNPGSGPERSVRNRRACSSRPRTEAKKNLTQRSARTLHQLRALAAKGHRVPLVPQEELQECLQAAPATLPEAVAQATWRSTQNPATIPLSWQAQFSSHQQSDKADHAQQQPTHSTQHPAKPKSMQASQDQKQHPDNHKPPPSA